MGQNLEQLLHSRSQIGIAIGLTMARYRVPEKAAWAHLRRISNDSNIRLRDLARKVIDDHNRSQ